jgi:hypothetical protein
MVDFWGPGATLPLFAPVIEEVAASCLEGKGLRVTWMRRPAFGWQGIDEHYVCLFVQDGQVEPRGWGFAPGRALGIYRESWEAYKESEGTAVKGKIMFRSPYGL